MDEKKRYIVIIQLKPDSDMSRIAEVVPAITGLMDRLSKGEKEQAFRSKDGLIFGFFIKTTAIGRMIVAELGKLHETVNEDYYLTVELGDDFMGHGFSRAWTWLQHH